MQIVFDDGDREHELRVAVNDPDATVGDLARVLAPTVADDVPGLVIGSRAVPHDRSLEDAGLHQGAHVRLPRVDEMPDVVPAVTVEVTGGIDAGRRVELPYGTVTLGRGGDCDLRLSSSTVSRRQAAINVQPGHVTVHDLDSVNGTWVNDEPVVGERTLAPGDHIRLGATELTLRRSVADDRPLGVDARRHATPVGTIPFNRPPRSAWPSPPHEVQLPVPPRQPTSKPPFNVVVMIAPLIFGGVMVVVFGNWMFAMFTLLTPVMVVGNWLQARRTNRKQARDEVRRFARELEELRRALAAAHDSELARRYERHPDPAEVARRALQPSTRLWERRPSHDDFLELRLGIGEVPWELPLAGDGSRRPGDAHPEVAAVLDAVRVLPRCPVDMSLADGGVVGIVGPRPPALALARALVVQAATHHGPANLPVAVLAAEEHAADWDWAKWLPHVRDPGGGAGRLLSGDRETSEALLDAVVASRGVDDAPKVTIPGAGDTALSDDAAVLLAVLDDESLTQGRRAPARSVLRGRAGPVAGIVIASSEDRLPAVCSAVVRLDGVDGVAARHLPATGTTLEDFLIGGMDDATARSCARALARFEDPELEIVGAGLPTAVRLLPLLGLEQLGPDAIASRWKAGGRSPAPETPIGVGEDGVFTLDLVRDGPHGLVAGTTGSGKSELLRSVVAGLAANVDPDHLNFVLVDYKGGAAFDDCARLPHTVGMVTDLDAHLGERALRCLEAELHCRERVLRDAGAQDLPAYLAEPANREPLPRLLVVIDEFATMAAELPDFIDSLVGIAQRGRSLGVHMILATQRPSGAVNENIKANTNLRIALRVQDAGDSNDVIGTDAAAGISRGQAGRAYVRLGPGEIVAIQTALSTAVTREGAIDPLEVARFTYGPAGGDVQPRPLDDAAADVPTDLARLVDAIRDAFAASSMAPPRKPWPEPLPGEVDLDTLVQRRDDGVVPFLLADDPEQQRQYPAGWQAAGNLLVYGIPGSGTTTTLQSLALALCRTFTPDELHLYVLDFGAGDLLALSGLPHCGAAVAPTDRERQTRLVRHLAAEVARRRQLDAGGRARQPRVVVMIDGLAAFRSAYDQDAVGMRVIDAVSRLVADGPEVGITFVATVDRAGGVPSSLASIVRQKLLLRLADSSDYTLFGVRAAAVPDLPPGRALVAETGQLVHVGRPAAGLDAAVEAIAAATVPPAHPPVPIGTLPTEVRVEDVVGAARLDASPWFLPLGVGESDLAPAGIVLYPGEHAVVAGPARSGRTTALRVLAAVARAAREDLLVVGLSGPRSHLGDSPDLDRRGQPGDAEALLADVLTSGRPTLVLVDDADTVDDNPAITSLLSADRALVHVVAAGRADAMRSLYAHWTKTVRNARVGALLVPDADLDGDLLGTRLPRQPPVALTVGRGYVVSGGEQELLQVATVDR